MLSAGSLLQGLFASIAVPLHRNRAGAVDMEVAAVTCAQVADALFQVQLTSPHRLPHLHQLHSHMYTAATTPHALHHSCHNPSRPAPQLPQPLTRCTTAATTPHALHHSCHNPSRPAPPPAGHFLTISATSGLQHLLRDRAGEGKLGTTLEASFRAAQGARLLQGRRCLLTPQLASQLGGKVPGLCAMVQQAGGSLEQPWGQARGGASAGAGGGKGRRAVRGRGAAEDGGEQAEVAGAGAGGGQVQGEGDIVLGVLQDRRWAASSLPRGTAVYSREWLQRCVVRQQLELAAEGCAGPALFRVQ
jgi:hypothetical protein